MQVGSPTDYIFCAVARSSSRQVNTHDLSVGCQLFLLLKSMHTLRREHNSAIALPDRDNTRGALRPHHGR